MASKKTLVIVESPTKARTISRILGKDFIVKACLGHIFDLPEKRFGVKIEKDFEPEFVILKGKKKILNEILSFAKNSQKVIMATDPDREGEAIGWHIAKVISRLNVPVFRARFNEITKNAVLKAVENSGEFDENKVNAQFARRILDRIVGYTISPNLSRIFKQALSAGRVQSTALKIICDREKQIKNFVPKVYYTIHAEFEWNQETFKGILTAKFEDKETAQKVLKEIESYEKAKVSKSETELSKLAPPPPFTTSTLQETAGNLFGFRANQTMKIAQELYEQGLITYMRTDSTRISQEFLEQLERFITASLGMKFSKRSFKTSQTAQDAHECIRPTSIYRTPQTLQGKLSKEKLALYELIWRRTIASATEPAEFEKVKLTISVGNYEFSVKGKRMIHEGFIKIYPVSVETEEVPSIPEGEEVKVLRIFAKKNKTSPPQRFTEPQLIRTLEKLGVGRPSTYATILPTLLKRNYVKVVRKRLKPTELGMAVSELLERFFPEVVSPEFTAKLEKNLDEIEEGKLNWKKLLRDFYFGGFLNSLLKFKEVLKD